MDRTSRDILRFMAKGILMTLPVLLPALLFFVLADPYKVFAPASEYYPDPNQSHARVGLNKGMVTVTNYEEQLRKGARYNAFIFGSSISCYYDADTWAVLLGGKDVEPYHFDSSSESLEQMAEKVEYLDRTGAPLKYALVVLDPLIMTSETDNNSPMSVAPPQFHPGILHKLRYYYTFFRGATNADFLKSYLAGMTSGEPTQIGRNPVFESQPIVYDPKRNQESIPEWDRMIASNPEAFYREHPLLPTPEKPIESEQVIDGDKEKALKKTAELFARHHTDYRIIIGPNRRKVALNRNDLQKLREIFGGGRVYDYSISHASDLEVDTLLYDNTHYRPIYATKLLRLTYPAPTK